MEKQQGFCSNGLIKLPPGFRFHPTDEELVVQYLKRKVLSCPLPVSIIPEVDVCKYDPWDLPGDIERERYFFSTREVKYPNGNRPNRAAGSGYWKATGTDKQIVASRSNQVVGKKKILVFYRGKPPNVSRTDWIMHEYRLTDAGGKICILPQRKSSTQNSMNQMEDWVLCRIFLKKRSVKIDLDTIQPCNSPRARDLEIARPGFIDFMSRPQAQSEISSDSSSITEVSSSGEYNGENNSCNNK